MNKKIAMAVMAAIGSAATQAQQAQDSDALEEVIVTAQFRSENLQETPLAITAITGDMLEARSQTSNSPRTSRKASNGLRIPSPSDPGLKHRSRAIAACSRNA